MSDPSKRPGAGAKDISDLKARLGLKKSTNPPPGGGTIPPPGAGSGTIPPPNTSRFNRTSGAIPIPPGATGPVPLIPDASKDPFGAMNAMAAHNSVAAQPQIVIVNDGQPVESVAHKSGAKRFIVPAAMIIGGLAAGVAVGSIGAQNKAFNQQITDAGKVSEDVTRIGKGLTDLQMIFQNGKGRGGDGKSFKPNDAELTASLKEWYDNKGKAIAPNFLVLANLQINALGGKLAEDTLRCYTDTSEVIADVKEHTTRSTSDEKILKEGQARLEGFNPFGYGGIVQIPSGENAGPVTLKLVQLGQPVCEDNKPGACNPPAGFQYRLDDAGNWGSKKLAAPQGGAANDTLVLIDAGSKALTSLVAGGASSYALDSYTKRVNGLSDAIDELKTRCSVVEKSLRDLSNRGKRFSFFM